MNINVMDYGAAGDGVTLDTEALQQAIDDADTGACVIIPAGRYLTGSLFLHSNMKLYLEKDAVLLGSTQLDDYPQIDTRVAGIEMRWPAALLNVIDCRDVHIAGPGTLDGQGEIWWETYWGTDGHGGRRATYDARNLRWIADYEIQRPRLLLVQNSRDIELSDITARRSGFWNIQLTYSQHVHVHDVTVCDNAGPSTDGIDVDSSEHVLIEGCTVACNDDDIVIKSGRDADGLRVARPTRDVEIRHCHIRSGAGITIGSEVSGGIENIDIHDCDFQNSDCGFRMKSSRLRGGYVHHVRVHGLTMMNVQFPFSWVLDWHPAYNSFIVPAGDIPEYWRRVAAPVPEEKQYTDVADIEVEGFTALYGADYSKVSRAIDIRGAGKKPLRAIKFSQGRLETREFGHIEGVKDLEFTGVIVYAPERSSSANDAYDQR